MLARGFLGLGVIFVGYADDFETGLLVGGKMGVIDDSAGADDSDSLAEIARQFRLVIELREGISHYQSPHTKESHGVCPARAFWTAAKACLASASFGFKPSAIPSSFSASSNL